MQYPLKIAICEDLKTDADFLRQAIEQSDIPVECTFFDSGEAFLDSFRAGQYDAVFLDIYMRGISGVAIAERIRGGDLNVVLAFTTSSDAHTLESYRLGVLKYIEKPVSAAAVRETLELALLKRGARPKITLPMKDKDETVPQDEVLYFEQRNHCVVAVTTHGALQTKQRVKLDQVQAELPSPPFLRCHQSFLVNLRYVRGFDEELRVFIVDNGDKVYIRRGDLKSAKLAYESYLFAASRGICE